MRRTLTGCTAVVTGASSGIGRAIALALADEGVRVALVGRDAVRLRAVAEAARAGASPAVICADLTDDRQVLPLASTIRETLGVVDVLVHSAGAIAIGPFAELRVDTLDEQYRLNVRAPFVLTQALLPLILTRHGQIVFINSSAGLHARGGVSQYAATKHAMKALADSLREEVHTRGVRVISIFPGRTATPMQESVRRMEGQPFDPAACLAPEDVATAVVAALTMPETAEVKDISIRPMGER